jgi:hypothetical protein
VGAKGGARVKSPRSVDGEVTPRKPPRGVLLALLLLASLPPFVAQATGSTVGSFTMFNRLERYHVELHALSPGRDAVVPLRTLSAHLTREAKRIILPAGGWAIGADQVDVVGAGLSDLARWVCAIEPSATFGRAVLLRDPFDPKQRVRREASERCPPRP